MTAEKAPLGERFEEAFMYANRLHAEQSRKTSGLPYISHLLSVTALVIQDGGSENEAIAALLHDAVEDQGGMETLNEIRQRFGEEVADIVAACSDAFFEPKAPWKERKRRHIALLRNAPASVQRVMQADKLHNARSILRDLRREGPAILEKFNGGMEGTLWYYRAMLEILGQSKSGYMIEELERVVSEIERLSEAA